MKAEAKFIEVDIQSLQLDDINPRLPERLKGATDKEVLNWMLSDATLIDLMASISENGFFSGEPIIVISNNDNYTVIEGNRRLAAIKLLANPGLAIISPKAVEYLSIEAKEKRNIPKKIWVYLVKERNEVENYLAFRHVTGVKQWHVISKARYLNYLYQQKPNKTESIYKALAKEIGSKAPYVRRLLIGYKAFEIIQSRKYFNIPDLDEESFDISLITDAITMHSAIAEFMGIDMESEAPFENINLAKLKEVTEWLYQKLSNGKTRVGENRNLRVLNKVIQNNSARDLFISGEKNLKEAAELTDLADENIRMYLTRSLQNILEAQKIVHRSTSPDKNDKKVADEIIDSADIISRYISKKIREREIF
ncbi:ParB/Srx family N-terminal domain-containing protein [Flectobacillus rivi]|uniref:ParB/Srx family N-terminal domain-containing protein n=1 Tax=Flectobacillus rivi TaxID=2984209 RepID=A0ABT6YYP1_9BACT|nr:ParB/Srx family N-terminal domain-containing protein [Flectobacillus rivi]MDI9873987.1 ParB/Srx family N-terminal domain-containing protein [Flectobacillus rivi]